MRRDLPAGTVSFLFTDVEGSTKLLHELGAEAYAEKLAEHRRIVREACTARGGVEVDTQGDAFFVAFPSAPEALEAAQAITEELAPGPIALRIGLHTGTPLLTEEGYVGEDVHFAARVAASAHGGQVVLSQMTRTLLDDRFAVIDLGEHRLKDIPEPVAIFQIGDGEFPPLKTISNTNLPRPASSFVGRESELSELLARIESGTRLLTLTGPGGSGKTRLALEAAASLVPEYKAGVFWVGLASLRDAALVTDTIAQTLGAKDGLAEHIGDRQMLLLLDNLEQVIEAAPELSALLQTCPNLSMLVTSRELLRVRGELEYPVPPLAEAEAISLFCERAQIEASEEIAELCQRLDNLPLAVELAAARTKALSPAQILERLSQRLDLLKGGRDADPRQHTLRATIAWSYELLSAAEQRLFRRLSVFAGGCTLEPAEEVADADLDTLQSLVEKSLLRFSNERYWMLETIREFAADRLEVSGEAEELQRRHAEEVARIVKAAAEEALSEESFAARIEPEYANVRSALAWARDGKRELGLFVASELPPFWDSRGLFAEGRQWLEDLLGGKTGDTPRLEVRCLVTAANLAQRQCDYGPATEALEKAHLLASEGGDEEALAHIANLHGIIEGLTGDFTKATASFEESVARWRKLGNDAELVWPLGNLGRALLEEGEIEAAQRALAESLALARSAGSQVATSWSLGILGRVAAARGDVVGAERLLCYALREIEKIGQPWLAAEWLEELATVASSAGNYARSGRLWGAAESLRDEIGAPLAPAEAKRHELAIRAARAAGKSFTDAVAEGRTFRREAAFAYALEPFAERGGMPETGPRRASGRDS
jgi:predicted ATPase/class 3 adenylate cyclase